MDGPHGLPMMGHIPGMGRGGSLLLFLALHALCSYQERAIGADAVAGMVDCGEHTPRTTRDAVSSLPAAEMFVAMFRISRTILDVTVTVHMPPPFNNSPS